MFVKTFSSTDNSLQAALVANESWKSSMEFLG